MESLHNVKCTHPSTEVKKETVSAKPILRKSEITFLKKKLLLPNITALLKKRNSYNQFNKCLHLLFKALSINN